jgi:hypothetical protein
LLKFFQIKLQLRKLWPLGRGCFDISQNQITTKFHEIPEFC